MVVFFQVNGNRVMRFTRLLDTGDAADVVSAALYLPE
jgi:hypothetical protein